MTQNRPKIKTSIRSKVILIICVTTTIVMLLGIGFGYIFGRIILRDMMGDVHRKMSQLLAGHLTKTLEDEVERMRQYAADPAWTEAIAKSNAKYVTMPDEAIRADLDEMNTKWKRSKVDTTLVKEFTTNPAALKLALLTGGDSNIARLALFDKYGALVAASGKTASFRAGDVKWLAAFFSSGDGKNITAGDIEFDETLNLWIIPFWLSVHDAQGATIGILKADLASGKFFSNLNSFRVDTTGRAAVIDSKGNLIFHTGVTQTNIKFCSEEDYRRLMTAKGKYEIISEPGICKDRVFVAFSEVTPPVLLDSGKVWRVMIEQELKEVFAPLNRIVFWIVVTIVILLLTMAAIGFVFSGFLVRPIEKLNLAALQIMKGNWDYKIDVRTGDEIESFAEAFREMITELKKKQEQLISARDELQSLYKNLEKKVEERTLDLSLARDKLDKYSKELEKALMIKSDFISMASHELRTPLAAIKEGIGIVLDEKAGGVTKEQKEFLDMAKRNVDRLSRLINDILDFQKIEYGKLMLRSEEHDINDSVKEVANTMENLAKTKNLKFITNLATDLPRIKFDKDKIAQVLTNLINNSIKFTEKGSITVETSCGDNIIKIMVKDTGIGVKDDDMPKLFQKFSQVDMGMERKTGGSGLGLTISKEIIERHGGKIWLESEFGKGTSVYFVLPIKERRY